ncbi:MULTISPECIES: CHASE2 domain-containing protein [Thermodesulfovibrio]|uniref:CHASE2 domain-containing protein n=1 Tax=Thermodesulfovibrio TaxID=28261 RepID=UPI00048B0143|nr:MULTISPECIES: adenylate/guanylate cyclase domain-containing protein [Thermodesulfovibrio]
MKSKLFIFFCIGFCSILVVIISYFCKIDFLNSIDLKLKDVKFRLRGDIEPDKRIVIVAIDSKSIDRLGRWPWDRKIIAKLIENLKEVRVIALDIVFSEPSNAYSDKLLSYAVNKNNVVAGYYFRDEETKIHPQSYLNLMHSKIKIVKILEDVKILPVKEFPYAELNIPLIKAQAGFFNIFPDDDGVYRKINLLVLYNGELYPHLSLKTLEKFKNSPLIVGITNYGIKGLWVGNELIPVDESGRLTINYYGKGGSFQTVSAVDIINGNLKLSSDNIVFIGATEMGISDIRNTPFDPVMPGVEISATVLSNILKQQYLIHNAWVTLLDIAFIAIPVLLLCLFLTKASKTLISLFIFSGITFLTYLSNFFIFKAYFLDLSIIYPFISLSICYLASEAYRNLIIEKKSKFIKKAFSSYIAPELVEIIIKNPDKLRLGGEKRIITVIFSDIRNFTTISESLNPEQLVTLLNNYLDPMTKIVLKHKGMLDKYIGDAIMAVYNAPVDLKEHAREAVLTALEMLKELKSLNEKFAMMKFPQIGIGIGINTGEAITGNMGTEKRFDYTAIGDTVNLASRLEGLNKFYGTKIIISESTFNGIVNKEQIFIRELDLIRVKGKKEPVKIYEVMEEDSPLISVVKDFEKALHLYRNCMFKEALKIFTYIHEEFSDQVSSIYEERCKDYILNPPPSDWDRVYTAREK